MADSEIPERDKRTIFGFLPLIWIKINLYAFVLLVRLLHVLLNFPGVFLGRGNPTRLTYKNNHPVGRWLSAHNNKLQGTSAQNLLNILPWLLNNRFIMHTISMPLFCAQECGGSSRTSSSNNNILRAYCQMQAQGHLLGNDADFCTFPQYLSTVLASWAGGLSSYTNYFTP